MKTLRVGISGSGFGVKCHLPALLAHPGFDVVALASPNSASSVARERNIKYSFASAAEMIAGCALDLVVVASPPFAHRDDVLAALDAGKHVICEKPFALNVEEAEEMVAASRDAGTVCGVSHEFRFVPERLAIRELVVNGHLAPLREIEITQLGRFLRLQGDRSRGWWFERNRGGGLAGALLSHVIDSANWTAGRAPRHATGLLRTANVERTDERGTFTSSVDDGCFALLDYGGGLVGRLTVDATVSVESFTLGVHAENRTAIASGPSIAEMTLYSVDDEETNELQCKPSSHAKFASINSNVPLLMDLYDEFIKQLETGKSLLPTFEEALETQRVLAAIGYSTAS